MHRPRLSGATGACAGATAATLLPHLTQPAAPAVRSPLPCASPAEAGKQLDIVRSPLDLRDLVTDVHCIIEAMVGREVSPHSQPG